MEKFESFKWLHQQSGPLILSNAWDAVTAKIFEDLGAPAVATSSAAVAWSQGYSDGRKMPAVISAQVAKNITRVLKVPLSYDFENGFNDDPAQVAENVNRLLEAGVAGINLEDGPDDPELLAKKIDAIKNTAAKKGQDLFINARTDVYLASLVPPAERLAESLKRGKLYAAAGADGLFVPWIKDEKDIATVTAQIALPLNVLCMRGLAPAGELGKWGVKRISSGPGIARIALQTAARLAKDLLSNGDSAIFDEPSIPGDRLQALFDI